MEIFQPWFLTHQVALLRPATWIPRWREAAATKAVLLSGLKGGSCCPQQSVAGGVVFAQLCSIPWGLHSPRRSNVSDVQVSSSPLRLILLRETELRFEICQGSQQRPWQCPNLRNGKLVTRAWNAMCPHVRIAQRLGAWWLASG